MEGEIYPLFSKPVYAKVIDIDVDKIIPLIEEYKFNCIRKGAGEELSDKDSWKFKSSGFKSTFDSSASTYKYVLKNKKMKFLKDKLMEEFYLYSSGVLKYTNKFNITTSWFTKCEGGQQSGFHNHNNCMLSGVLYLTTDENCGNIKFQNFDDKRYLIHKEEYNVFNSIEYSFKPSEGLLLIFPSEMWHRIEENKSDITRHSLAFNLTPVGLIGYDWTDSHMKIKV